MLVLPLVPVTATRASSGCGPASAAAICARRAARLGSRISGRGGTPGGQTVSGRRQHRDRAARYRVGNEGAAVGAVPRQRGEQVAGHHLAAVGGDAGHIQGRHGLPRGNEGGGGLHGAHEISEPQGRLPAPAGQAACHSQHSHPALIHFAPLIRRLGIR